MEKEEIKSILSFLLKFDLITDTFTLKKEVQKWQDFFEIYNTKIDLYQLLLKDEEFNGFTLDDCKPLFFSGFLVIKK